jgi:transposase
MPTKLKVELDQPTRDELDRLVKTGRAHARTIRHAHTLLLSDQGGRGPAWSDEKVADALGCGTATVARTRARFVREGLDEALRVLKDRPGRPPKIDGTAEAHLIAMACSKPPRGRARWTVRLLADRFVELGLAEGWLEQPVSRETVREALKKTGCALTGSSRG